MKKLRLIGLLAATVLLAFALVVSCGSPGEGPGTPGGGGGEGPDGGGGGSGGTAWGVPSAGGGSGGGATGTEIKTPPVVNPVLISFEVDATTGGAAAVGTNVDDTTHFINITFSGPVKDFTTGDVTFKGLNGAAAVKDNSKLLVSDAAGENWTISLDPAKTKAGVIEVTVKKTGVTETPVSITVEQKGVTASKTITLGAVPWTTSTALSGTAPGYDFHTANTAKIQITLSGAVPSTSVAFDPEKHIVIKALQSHLGGSTGFTRSKAEVVTADTVWDIPVTVTNQGLVQVYSTHPDVNPRTVTVALSKAEAINFSISAAALNGPTTDTLYFSFDVDPKILYNNAKIPQSALKTGTGKWTGGTQDTLDTIIAKAPNGNKVKWDVSGSLITYTLDPADVLTLKAGDVFFYFDINGIGWPVISGRQLEASRKVTIERQPLAKLVSAKSDEWLGITDQLVLTFDRAINKPTLWDTSLFTISNSSLKPTSAVDLKSTDGGTTWIYPLEPKSVTAVAKDLTINLTTAASAPDVDPTSKPKFDLKVTPVKISRVEGAAGVTTTNASDEVTLWITFDAGFKDRNGRGMAVPDENVFTVGQAAAFTGTAAIQTGSLKWVDPGYNVLEMVIEDVKGAADAKGNITISIDASNAGTSATGDVAYYLNTDASNKKDIEITIGSP